MLEPYWSAVSLAVLGSSTTLLALIYAVHTWTAASYKATSRERQIKYGFAYAHNFRLLTRISLVTVAAVILSAMALLTDVGALAAAGVGALVLAGVLVAISIVAESQGAAEATLYNYALGVVKQRGSEEGRREVPRFVNHEIPTLPPSVEAEVIEMKRRIRKDKSLWPRDIDERLR